MYPINLMNRDTLSVISSFLDEYDTFMMLMSTSNNIRETYDYDWLYLSMFSVSGCVFTANVLFKDEERNVVKRQKNMTDDSRVFG